MSFDVPTRESASPSFEGGRRDRFTDESESRRAVIAASDQGAVVKNLDASPDLSDSSKFALASVMPGSTARDDVENVFGSIDVFAEVLYFDHPDVISGEKSIIDASAELGIEPRTLDYFLRKSTAFRALLRSMLTNEVFDIGSETQHLRTVASIAKNEGRTVATPSGKVVKVSNTEKAVMDAGEYLNSYRGTPLKGEGARNAQTVNITFGGAPVPPEQFDETRTIDARGQPSRNRGSAAGNGRKSDQEGDVGAHRPLTASTPPPSGVQKRLSREVQQALSGADDPNPGLRDTDVGADFDFVSDRAQQMARDAEDDDIPGSSEPRREPRTPEREPNKLSRVRDRLKRAHLGVDDAE